MPVVIPFTNDFSNFSEEVTIDDVTYRLDFIYNNRSGVWSMSVLDLDLNPIISGVALVLNYDLLAQFPGIGLPEGEMYAIDTTEKEEKIDRKNIGPIITLIYLTEEEVASI